MKRRLSVIASLALGIVVRHASAQSAEAEELFHQGRAALAAGDNATACVKLDASERLERAVGTLMSLATCEEALGHLAGARQHLQEAAEWADASHDQLHRGPVARAKFAVLDRRVPRLTLKLAAAAPRDTHVTRDGIDLGTAFDMALPVDPGTHVILATVAGYESGKFEVSLAEGETRTLEVSPGPATGAKPPALVPPAPPERAPAPVRAEGPSGSSGLRTAGWVTGAVGLASLGVGTYFGVSASSSWSSAKNDCKPGACGEGSHALDEKTSAQTAATISTVTVIGGGVALATGVLLYILGRATAETPAAPSAWTLPSIGPMLGAKTGGMAVVGAF